MRGRLARLVRTVVEAMTAVPTIVAGLFIYSLLIIQLGWERSGFAASLALSVSMIPVVTTTAEVVLRLVPNGLREASLALGTTQWQTVRRVVLPTARPGLVTAVLLGVARVIGETSPVLLVAGSTNELNYDPTHGPQLSLPLFVFTGMRQPLDVAIAARLRCRASCSSCWSSSSSPWPASSAAGSPATLSGRQRRRSPPRPPPHHRKGETA